MSNREDMSSDYEYHECEAQDFGQSHGTQHTHAILAVAAGVKELVELLRPLVDTITAKPEPLKLRTDGTGPMPCLAGDLGSNGFRRCMEPYGHDGDHRHRDGLNAGVEYVWTQRHGDVPPTSSPVPAECGAQGPMKDHGAFGTRQYVCREKPGHVGNHSCKGPMGNLEVWPQSETAPAYQTVDEKRCTNLSPLVDSRPTMRCIRLFGHSGECRFPAPVEPQPPKPFPWPVVADIEYGPDNSESGRCTATLGPVRCAYRRDRHYPYDRSAPRVHASEYLDGEGAIWR